MKNFFKVIRYIKPYWFIALLAPIFMIAEVSMILLLPKTTGDIIDIGIEQNDLHQVIILSLYMLLYTFLSVIFGFFSNYFANWSSASMANDLRIDSFKKSLNMSFENLDEFKIGKVITRVTSDTNMLRWMTRNFLRVIFKAPYLLFGSIYFVIQLSPKLAMILIFIFPLLIIVNFFLVKRSYPKYKKVQETLDDVNTLTQENLENIRVIKAFNRSEYEKEKFEEQIDELTNTTIKANIITSFSSPVFMFVINMSIVAVLYFGGMDVINNKYEIGSIVSFLLYLGKIAVALQMINGLIKMIPRASSSANRIIELLSVNSELDNENSTVLDKEITGKIEFKNVIFAYNNCEPSLNNISFTINPGERIGIIGTTGSGKTTLTNLISRFYDVNEGEILIDDIDVRDYDIYNLRSQISTVMQRPLLFAGTIGDNICFGDMDASEEELIKASNNACAAEFINKFKDGYDTILGERGVNLSGGQKQRLSMARSLITNPKILIFDDSTSAVDMTTEAKILESLNKNTKDSTVIIIAQRIKSILNADKIIVLEKGQITGLGTHKDLLKTNKLYKSIYEQQIGGNQNE